MPAPHGSNMTAVQIQLLKEGRGEHYCYDNSCNAATDVPWYALSSSPLMPLLLSAVTPSTPQVPSKPCCCNSTPAVITTPRGCNSKAHL